MKNRKGFTLVELLVCIAIIATISITVGVNMSDALKRSTLDKEVTSYKEIFNAAALYAELRENYYCIESGCDVTIEKLIDQGLLDEDIINRVNPIYKNKNKFTNGDSVHIQIDTSGQKNITYEKCGYSFTQYNYNDIENWGECE